MKKIAFIGAGAMAEAVVAGLVNTKFIEKQQIYVSNKENKERLKELHEKYGVTGILDKTEVLKDADVIFLATKPYDMENAITEIKELIQENQIVISVVAGLTTSFIEDTIGKSVPVIRSMPNTSATIGLSATAITKGTYATDDHVEIAKQIFQSVGTVSVVAEDDMHMVTALSGSGPAYVYYLVEAMEAVAKEVGFDGKVAKDLITQTIIGAGNMLQQSTEPASVLRENVTSPNGTTAAGLQALSEHDFQTAVKACVKSAAVRSRELSGE